MSVNEAHDYHAEQIGVFAATEADLVSAFTLNYVNEAIGVARAAHAAEMPVVISFTVETDGNLPDGQPLREAIDEVDSATRASAAYFMVNCAHPDHFAGAIDGLWALRIRGIRANASRRSHAELDEAPDLDAGDPHELAGLYADLRRSLPWLNVFGACCGGDLRHVTAIARAVVEEPRKAA